MNPSEKVFEEVMLSLTSCDDARASDDADVSADAEAEFA